LETARAFVSVEILQKTVVN